MKASAKPGITAFTAVISIADLTLAQENIASSRLSADKVQFGPTGIKRDRRVGGRHRLWRSQKRVSQFLASHPCEVRKSAAKPHDRLFWSRHPGHGREYAARQNRGTARGVVHFP